MSGPSFESLAAQINALNHAAVLAVGRSVQQTMSLRSWLIGRWIVVYQQHGSDRAAYGADLLGRLATHLKAAGHAGLSARNLAYFRGVALAYPDLDASALASRLLPAPTAAWALAGEGAGEVAGVGGILQRSAKSSGQALAWRDPAWMERLFTELSFTHLAELSRIDDEAERGFYELQCLRERWTARELIRQRDTMLYQRVGLSVDRDAVLALARDGRLDERPSALVRDPYVLEFLGLPSVVDEATLESAILDNLQRFLLELGSEFCFVARQYRVTVGNRHHHLDLLFFHRRLRCLVAVDLKTGEFTPQDAGQMRFYLNYLAAEVALDGESPPIGILLCAAKDEEVVQFATATDDDVLVARYLLELPTKERLVQWLHDAREAAVSASGERPRGDA